MTDLADDAVQTASILCKCAGEMLIVLLHDASVTDSLMGHAVIMSKLCTDLLHCSKVLVALLNR